MGYYSDLDIAMSECVDRTEETPEEALSWIGIEGAIVGDHSFCHPLYPTAVYTCLCHANVVAGVDCRLDVPPWRDTAFPTRTIE